MFRHGRFQANRAPVQGREGPTFRRVNRCWYPFESCTRGSAPHLAVRWALTIGDGAQGGGGAPTQRFSGTLLAG